MPNAAVWRTRRRAKKFLEKKRKETEAGEEREGDDDEDADAEDGDGDRDGDGDGGDQGDGPGHVRMHQGLTGISVWGWRSPGRRVKGWWVTGLVGKGEGGVSSWAPRAPSTTQEEQPRAVQRH